MAGRSILLPLAVLLSLASCGGRGDGALEVDFIDTADGLFGQGERLSPGAQHLRAATQAGLVALNQQGEVIPALADRWIVTDDGRSFIFRLRDGAWPDGRELTADSVRRELERAIRRVRGTSLALDLRPVSEIRAMAGRVIEVRLTSSMPTLLQVLAQPELTLTRGEGGMGPMVLDRRDESITLTMKPPVERGLPEEEDWREDVRPVLLRPVTAEQAMKRFGDGTVDVVLGGTLGALPLAPTGPLTRGTVQIDPAIGLFGLRFRRAEGFLATPEGREALAMALDRSALVAPFNIGGWVPSTRIVAPLPDDPGFVAERWADQPLEALRAQASSRVASWRATHGGEAVRVTLALPRAPGLDRLFGELSLQLATIGIVLERVAEDEPSDMVLVDRVARYAAPRWFLNQFNCTLRQGLCEAEADILVALAEAEADPAARAARLAEAELRLAQANVYIPFGSPLRWSLVRSSVTGFAANAWAFHPLPPFAEIPN